MNSGVVETATQKISSITPNSLIYIAGGDLKRLPLAATGTDPKAAIQAAGVTILCKFSGELTNISPSWTDYAVPNDSSYYATTKGADGVCATADDGLANVTFSATGKPLLTAATASGRTTGLTVVALRDPATLKRGESVTAAGIKAVEISVGSAIVESAGSLSLYSLFKTASNTFTINPARLDATVTAGTGWESAGFDADSFYVFRNSAPLANLTTSTWKLVRISRVSSTATLLASGSGNLTSASTGSNSILGTIVTASGFSLNKFSKATPGLPVVLQQPSLSTFVLPQAMSQGTFQLFRANLVNGVASSYSVEMLDEATNATFYTRANVLLFDYIRPDSLPLNSSMNASGVVFSGDSLGAAGSLGSSFLGYNTTNKTATLMGQFLNAAAFGVSRAIASTGGSTGTNFGTGSISAISTTGVISAPRRYFSFNPSAANSIVYTTTTK